MSATRYTLRDASPSQIERAVAQTVRLLVYRNQVPVAATGTYTLQDAGGVTIATGAVSSDGTDTTRALLSTDTTTAMAYSTRWRETWALTVAGEAVTFHRDAWLVRSALWPVVTVDDLTSGRHRDLAELVDGGVPSIEGYIIEAWSTIVGDLIKKGKRPSLIMESWALRQIHIYRSLQLCFLDASTRFSGEDRFTKLHEHYLTLADEEWTKGMKFQYDANEDGIADGQVAGSTALFLTAGRMTGPYSTTRAGYYR